ncbi:MAG TPA: 2-oxoacid:acceptor oxidoreductase subunit alpha [Bdellovibrionales bacterium]|nr:2-oxoacid:acceptor oxidoreductase subunit alpha [Bdellovibrionales bacterium]
MNPVINDFVLNVATVNGSGSQSSNMIILKALFRMGIPTGGKNLFPSNIAGLPTWFSIRVNRDGYIARKRDIDFTIAMNPATVAEDIREVKPGGVFMYNDDLKFDRALLRNDTINMAVPFRKIVDGVTTAIKMKKFLTNMVYVGLVAELTGIDKEVLRKSAMDQFGKKNASIVEENLKAIEAGAAYAAEHFKNPFPFKVQSMNKTQGKILIDGNTAAAMGLVYGGCTFMSWYPITPSSSLAEAFAGYAAKYRKTADGKNSYSIIQAEDELSAMGMVLGASWTGARAMTTTSGPGISLMSEFAGYSYFAEIPAVVWDVQRAGPSTGLPTRTSQGDISFIATISHGDTKHIMLFPASPQECFDYGQTAFDLAERLQTAVFVLSDLDLGMNYWITDRFQPPTKPFDRGKVMTAETLSTKAAFGRYEDSDGDGIPYRTLPGTKHPMAPYFTRGSGHDEKARYTESNEVYKRVLDRLAKKFNTAKTYVPAPIIENTAGSKVGVIAFGSTDIVMAEVRSQLKKNGVEPSYMRIRAYPFNQDVETFIKSHDRVYVVEQNRDGQMKNLLTAEFSHLAPRLRSVLHYDGLPVYADAVVNPIVAAERGQMN